MTPSQREAIVAEARSWLKTPYHDHGAVKGAGADCALYPLAVYRSVLGNLPDIPLPDYQMQWHLHRDEEKYLNCVRSLGAIEVETPQPGDFLLVHVGRVLSHGAIVLVWPDIIHAVNPRGVVYGNGLDVIDQGRRKHLFFTFA